MMKNRYFIKTALITAGMAYLISCSSDTSSDSSSVNVDTKTASLKLAVNFKDVSSQFLSQDVDCISYVYYHPDTDTYITGELTQTSSSVELRDLPVGNAGLFIYAGKIIDGGCYVFLDKMSVALELTEGTNTFTGIMIGNARWTFVDNNNNPVEIVLNKTKPDSGETLYSFSILNDRMYYAEEGPIFASSIDETLPSGREFYALMWRGANLNACEYQPPSDTSGTVCFSDATYNVQFVGPNSSYNAFDGGNIRLEPYVDSNGETWRRETFILGVPPLYEELSGYYGYTEFYPGEGYYGYYLSDSYFSVKQNDGTDVLEDLDKDFGYTSVVNADTMKGIILEVATKESSIINETVCSWDLEGTDIFDCPDLYPTTGEIVAMALKKTAGISSQSRSSDDCYYNVALDELRHYYEFSSFYAYCDQSGCDYNLDGVIDENDDTNGDGVIDYRDNRKFYVSRRYRAEITVCVHPFTARAQEMPQEDRDIFFPFR